MKTAWLFILVVAALVPAHAGEKEKELCADINGLRICEIPEPPPDLIIKVLPALTDPPSHLFFRAEI